MSNATSISIQTGSITQFGIFISSNLSWKTLYTASSGRTSFVWKPPVLIPEHASQGAMQAFREIPIKIVQYQNTALQLKALRFQRLSEPLHKYPVPAQTKTFHNQWKAPVLIPEHASQGAMQAFHSNENRAGSKYCTTYLLDLWPFRQISVWLYHCGIMLRSKIPVREISGESVDSLHHRSHPPVLRRLFVFNIINQGGKQWQPAADSVGTAEILTLSPIDERFNTRYS
ncbi:hypothetical protein T4A_12021 [Trichinella pseudospiralis]|uniref:Uncharacterized protein n=1 Tax=Trichinella pseudospiralis TaxID=6337 RepID=A0A0V1EGJ5_TRIPS|nr:hypothetical protein T4A_12021 [Trichinella pseudospiralis]